MPLQGDFFLFSIEVAFNTNEIPCQSPGRYPLEKRALLQESSLAMCGGDEKDLLDPRRFGALAVVNDRSGLEQDLSGRIVFFNSVDSKSTVATHVRFIPVQDQQICHDLTLTIFSTGDLTVPTSECQQFGSFTLPMALRTDLMDHSSLESRLGQQLLLEVGGDGVIGRRVAISSPGSSKTCMAEGIVGFNSGSIALAA